MGSKTKQVVSIYDVFCFKIIGKLLDALKVSNISSTKILPNVAFVFLRGIVREFPGEWVLGWEALGGGAAVPGWVFGVGWD